MTDAYRRLMFPPRVGDRERRTLLTLRAIQLVLLLTVVGLFFPPVWLAAFWIPVHLRRYSTRLRSKGNSEFLDRTMAATSWYNRRDIEW